MSNLFDRYFQVLAGRLTGDTCGSLATLDPPSNGVFTLDWPADSPVDDFARAGDVANRSSTRMGVTHESR